MHTPASTDTPNAPQTMTDLLILHAEIAAMWDAAKATTLGAAHHR